jgi:hypothetical protein
VGDQPIDPSSLPAGEERAAWERRQFGGLTAADQLLKLYVESGAADALEQHDAIGWYHQLRLADRGLDARHWTARLDLVTRPGPFLSHGERSMIDRLRAAWPKFHREEAAGSGPPLGFAPTPLKRLRDDLNGGQRVLLRSERSPNVARELIQAREELDRLLESCFERVSWIAQARRQLQHPRPSLSSEGLRAMVDQQQQAAQQAEARIAHLEQHIEHLERRQAAEIQQRQHPPPDARRALQAAAELEQREHQALLALADDPPTRLIQRLGRVPTNHAARRGWLEQALNIERDHADRQLSRPGSAEELARSEIDPPSLTLE